MHPLRRAAFTLIELLVVISIISLLMAMLLPSLGNARASARGVLCKNNLRQMGIAMNGYMSQSKDCLTGIMAPAWFTDPSPGQTSYFLEAARAMGVVPPQITDTLQIKTQAQLWYDNQRFQLCPEDRTWGVTEAYGSYGTNYSTWSHFLKIDGGSIYYPTLTQVFDFRNMRKTSQSVMLSEILHHASFGIMDGTTQTANVIDPAYVAGGWLDARHAHLGASVSSVSGSFIWEGINNYLYFDGHVDGRVLPPYEFGPTLSGDPPAGANLVTYAAFVGS